MPGEREDRWRTDRGEMEDRGRTFTLQVLLMRRPGGAEALLRTELCVRVWLPARSGQVTRGKRGGGGTIVTRHTDRGRERERERERRVFISSHTKLWQ